MTATRSALPLYCAQKGFPLEKCFSRRREDSQHTQFCGEAAFRRLHNAKCAVEKQRNDQRRNSDHEL